MERAHVLCEYNTFGIECKHVEAELLSRGDKHEWTHDLQAACEEYRKKQYRTRRLCDEYIAPDDSGSCAAKCSKGDACLFLHVNVFLEQNLLQRSSWSALKPRVFAILNDVEQRTAAVRRNIANGTFIPTPQQAQTLVQDIEEQMRIRKVLTTTYVDGSTHSQERHSIVALQLHATVMAIYDCLGGMLGLPAKYNTR